ncbi:MAG: hypothetical protein DLM67_23815 [Candidatus Nephthysia bennettiae]|nr:MAG: hypothetical protein DLM67_23815 [Candidatus Dormibacteraeota bacterium]
MVAFALLGLTACGQLDTSAVEQQRVQLKSTVAEASFLADGTAHSEFTAPFVRARAGELSDDATNIQSGLADSQVAAPARAKAARLREAARLLAGAMDRLRASPGDPRLAAGLSAQLKQAQAALDAA